MNDEHKMTLAWFIGMLCMIVASPLVWLAPIEMRGVVLVALWMVGLFGGTYIAGRLMGMQ